MIKKFWEQLEQVGVAFDQFLVTLIGLALVLWTSAIYYADETLSAMAYRKKDRRRRWYVMYRMINFIFFLQHDHCLEAYLSEKKRNHMPAAYRSVQKG